MIKQKKGKIINVSSQAGSVGLLQRAAYCSSKGAVNQLTRVLAIEWAKYNINVNAVAPTFIETPFTAPMFQKEGFKEYVLGNIPLGRVGKPEAPPTLFEINHPARLGKSILGSNPIEIHSGGDWPPIAVHPIPDHPV